MLSGLDYNYLWAIIAFAFGALAGYQGIYDFYGPQSKKALVLLPGIAYLLSRGAFPALAFSVLYGYRLIAHDLWLQSVLCGSSWELFVRSKWYVKKIRGGGKELEDLYKGPLDIVRAYQTLFLKAIDPHFAKRKIAFAKANLEEGLSYSELANRVIEGLSAWSDEDTKAKVQSLVESYSTPCEKELANPKQQTAAQINLKYNYRLCHTLVRELGEDATKILIESKR